MKILGKLELALARLLSKAVYEYIFSSLVYYFRKCFLHFAVDMPETRFQ